MFGVPVIYSSQVREDLDSNSGRDAGGSGDSTKIIFPNKKAFAVGTREVMEVETAKIPTYDGSVAWITGRFAFDSLYADTDPVVAIGYNIGSST